MFQTTTLHRFAHCTVLGLEGSTLSVGYSTLFVTGSSQAQQTPRSANERTPWRTPSATDPHPQDWAHQGKAKHLSNLQAM